MESHGHDIEISALQKACAQAQAEFIQIVVEMYNPEQLRLAILKRLSTVIDPETRANVMRMKLIENLVVDATAQVSYTIRPSSPLCPVAVLLAVQVKMVVASVPGVNAQKITVKNYIEAENLIRLINQEA
jgi:metal-sulfur cluster biosynthetic enzyme